MEVRVVSITPPTKNAAVATAKVELRFGNEEKITLADLRVLKNQHSELWIGFPTRNINGTYVQLVFASLRVKMQIDAAVLEAYRKWVGQARQVAQQSVPEGGAL